MGKVIISGGCRATAPVALPPVGTALNAMTWEDVRAISDAGVAADYFSVGDTKSIVINGTVGATTFSNLSIDTFILGFDHNSSVEGTNKIHFGIGKINGVDVALCDSKYGSNTNTSGVFTMNTVNSNSGGWASSHMRTTVLGSDSDPLSPTTNTLLAALPADLRAVMKHVTKHSDNTGGSSSTASRVTTTEDYLPLLAEWEVFGSRTYANSAEQNYQEQYAYYSAGNSKIKYKHGDNSTAATWWLRSVRYNNTTGWCRTNSSGSHGYGTNALASSGVSPLFCV